jgi:glycerol-3-phosphate acyltransferase PlsX
MMKAKEIDAMATPGHTGATVAATTVLARTLPGVDRPALGASMPAKEDRFLLMDAGANPDCGVHNMVQFALMGEVYARYLYHKEQPRVGLLSVGGEDIKGCDLTKETFKRLEQLPINFIGNVEGRDVLLGGVDVVVCDGFSGNVLLKSIEGTAMFMGSLMKNKIFKRSTMSKIGYLFCKKGVDEVVKMMDYREIGGTQFLGIKKPVIKAHGSSDRLAFRNAVRQAMEAAECDMTAELEQSLAAMKENTDDQ